MSRAERRVAVPLRPRRAPWEGLGGSFDYPFDLPTF